MSLLVLTHSLGMTCSHAVCRNASACLLLCRCLGEMHIAPRGASQPYDVPFYFHMLSPFPLSCLFCCLCAYCFLPFPNLPTLLLPIHPSPSPPPSPFLLLQFWTHHWPLGCRFCPNCHRHGDRMHLCVLLLLLDHTHTHTQTTLYTFSSDYK